MVQAHDPLIGKQLGAYLIQSRLGEGGMARVYKAYHARLRREVAIKVIASQMADQADFQARFEREAQLIASLEHHNIVAVYDFGEVEGLTYLVMQYIGGGTLRDQLYQKPPLAPARAANYALQMARALHHAHQRGIVHRDIKPQNMLVSASDPDQLLLSDFGIAKLFDSSQEATQVPISTESLPGTPSLTRSDQVVGTAEYMAPEQIQHQPVDARTDVYALGVVLFQMLVGRIPFEASSSLGLMYHHVVTPAPQLREINPYVPESLAWITAKALAKAPEARFQSAQEMAQALEAALNTPLSQAAPPPPANYATESRLSNITPALPSTSLPTHLSQYPQVQPRSATSLPPSSMPAHSSPHSQPAMSPALTPPPNSSTRNTASDFQLHIPAKTRPRATPLRGAPTIATIALVVLVLALVAWRVLPTLGITTMPSTGVQPKIGSPSVLQPFTETFADNHLQWPVGMQNGLTSQIQNGRYILTTDSSNNTHFPYPATNGALPDNFSLTAQFTQTGGDLTRSYGLVFHLVNVGQISCYVFVVNSYGQYALLKYPPGNPASNTLAEGQSAAIHGLNSQNTLQAIARGHTFQFKINGQGIQLNGAATLTDSSYAGGQIGLLVSGPNASFVVSKVELTLP